MNIVIRKAEEKDLPSLIRIWNQVVQDGIAFPQIEPLDIREGAAFFSSQTFTAAAVQDDGTVVGLYILHPNNVGRCGHIANASFAVETSIRGAHIGEALVKHCLDKARECGFSILQFNAVVDSNIHARHLYERLGFVDLGIIPKGFKMLDGHFEDIHIMYHTL